MEKLTRFFAIGWLLAVLVPSTTFAYNPPTIDAVTFDYASNSLSGSGTCNGSTLYAEMYDAAGNMYMSGSPTTPTNTNCVNGSYVFNFNFGYWGIAADKDEGLPNLFRIYNEPVGIGSSYAETTFVRRVPPALQSPAWTQNPLSVGQDTTLSVSQTYPGAQITQVEYFIDTDPGPGAGIPMSFSAGTWNATFGSSLPVNTYSIGVRGKDSLGNWGPLFKDVLAVYNPSGAYVTGHSSILPSVIDNLPIAFDSKNKAEVKIGFTNVKYGSATVNPDGSFDLSYTVKNNKDELSLTSTSLVWLGVSDALHASIQGYGHMTSITNDTTVASDVPFRVDLVLGQNGAPDQVTIRIYQSTFYETPQYVVSDSARSSNIKIVQ